MEEIASLPGIPDSYEILAVVPFGYPVRPSGQSKKKRKPLAELAPRGRSGQEL